MENIGLILVIEDDQFLQNMVEETLTDGGFTVVMEDALELLGGS